MEERKHEEERKEEKDSDCPLGTLALGWGQGTDH